MYTYIHIYIYIYLASSESTNLHPIYIATNIKYSITIHRIASITTITRIAIDYYYEYDSYKLLLLIE